MKFKYLHAIGMCCLIVLFLNNCLYSQEDSTQLKIGDQMPLIAISGYLKDSAKVIPVSGLYHDKVLIIDFWATWCSPCIAAFSKLQALEKKFEGKLSVIAVTYQDTKVIAEFFKQNPQYQDIFNDVVISDTILSKLFPYNSIPYEIVIGTSGKILAMTSIEEVDDNLVRTALQNKRPNIIMKQGFYDKRKPFPFIDSNYLFRSVLTRSVPEIGAGGIALPSTIGQGVEPIEKLLFYNRDIRNLYMIAAFGSKRPWQNSNLFQIEGAVTADDTLSFMWTNTAFAASGKYKSVHEWMKDKTYCYELLIPAQKPDTLAYKYMLEDLNRYLPFEGHLEKRMKDCYVLINKTDESRMLKSKGSKPEFLFSENGILATAVNKSVDEILDYIQIFSWDLPLVNETSNKDRIDMDFRMEILKPNNILEITEKFRKYGFDLVKAKRKVDVLILTKKEG